MNRMPAVIGLRAGTPGVETLVVEIKMEAWMELE